MNVSDLAVTNILPWLIIVVGICLYLAFAMKNCWFPFGD